MKIKAHRGEPLNERADDLSDEGKTLAKAGDSYQWTDSTTRLVYSYYDRAAHQWKKGTSSWSTTETIRNAARRWATESLMEDRLQGGADKWRTELFKTSTRALGRWADRTGRLDREVGDSSIGAMDAEVGMEQNGDKNDAGTVSHYPGNYYVDSPPPPSSQMLHSRLLDTPGR